MKDFNVISFLIGWFGMCLLWILGIITMFILFAKEDKKIEKENKNDKY